jgi:hypothetical protein
MNNTNKPAAKNTARKIGHSVTCTECSMTYGDHLYLCSKDPKAFTFFAADRKFLGI